MSKEIADKLSVVLADTYALYLKTQNYHWHVTGPHFKPIHELLEEQYTDLAEAVDNIAERIITIGEKAPATFSEYNQLKTIEDGNSDADAKSMLMELADDQDKICVTIKQALECASQNGDEASINILSDRIEIHEKNSWMLKASSNY